MRGRQPGRFRQHFGFGTSVLAIVAATPAIGAPLSTGELTGAAPLALTIGAIGFCLISALLLRRAKRRSEHLSHTAQNDLARIRAELDLTQSILDGMDELTLIWRDAGQAPIVCGQPSIVSSVLPNRDAVGDFRTWLSATEGAQLSQLVSRLKSEARSFDSMVTTLDGARVRVSGRVLGGAAVLRILPEVGQNAPEREPSISNIDATKSADQNSIQLIFGTLSKPAWIRNGQGELVYANLAYLQLAQDLDVEKQTDAIPEIFDAEARSADAEMLARSGPHTPNKERQLNGKIFNMVLFQTEAGSAGILRPEHVASSPALQTAAGVKDTMGPGIIEAIALPVAIFDANRKIKHFNQAYCDLWGLDADWLNKGIEEGVILDKLRTKGLLPSEADYRVWRSKHLNAYKLTAPREEPWYLPDGRALSVVAVPNTNTGGIIYVFENVTEQLALESRYNALIEVQSETLSALSEGVAVFGTNGRLTLSNPRLSSLWKLPMNELGAHPHIDQIAEFCAATMPDDGATIWGDLKQNIIDLNPARTDRTGRITRADGRMIDYAVTRLPDGQTMMTFADVTESANFQKILKERNDALVTADRLKDAFVQNVSYELRSPLTNIIGFADLLASGSAGALNEKQKSYTDYIRASSQSLGVLIDNILDLATADAGVAELELAPQDIPALVERARAGLIGTLTAGGDETPPNLSVEIDPDLPDFIADGTRIVQVIYNLLSNAVRFSASGTPVRLIIAARGNHVVFTVEDEGIGISDEMRAAVFQRFEGKSSEGRQRGAGLGLAIVKTFVNLHGGTISLERREPKGTRVIVSIPANPAEAVSAAE